MYMISETQTFQQEETQRPGASIRMARVKSVCPMRPAPAARPPPHDHDGEREPFLGHCTLEGHRPSILTGCYGTRFGACWQATDRPRHEAKPGKRPRDSVHKIYSLCKKQRGLPVAFARPRL